MAVEPADRFAGAGELKDAIQTFLVHREAARLADHASGRLAELLAALAVEGGDRESALQPVRRGAGSPSRRPCASGPTTGRRSTAWPGRPRR